MNPSIASGAAAALLGLGAITSVWLATPPPPNKKYSLLQAQCNVLQNAVMTELAKRGIYFKAGEAQRSKQQAAWYASQGKGIKDSAHIASMAWDYYRILPDGTYSTAPKDYAELGAMWKSAGDQLALQTIKLGKKPELDTNWGGDFIRLKDYNHISCTTRTGSK
jgi:hypothetical protein